MIIQAGLLDRVLRFCTTLNKGRDVRPRLNTIIVSCEPEITSFVTTNGHYIGRVLIACPGSRAHEEHMVPLDQVPALRTYLAPMINKAKAGVELLDAIGTVKLLEGVPVDWRRVVCDHIESTEKEVVLNSAYLADAAKALRVLDNSKYPTVKMSSIKDGTCGLLRTYSAPGIDKADILIMGCRR